MFAVYIYLARPMPDGNYLMVPVGTPVDTYEDFCYMLDSIVTHYSLTLGYCEIDTHRNGVIIHTNDEAMKIFVTPNYCFNCMNDISLEEIESKIVTAISMRIVYKCTKCGYIEVVRCKDLKEMARLSGYNDLPDGWMRVYGGELCPSCTKEYRKFLDKFLKNNSENS